MRLTLRIHVFRPRERACCCRVRVFLHPRSPWIFFCIINYCIWLLVSAGLSRHNFSSFICTIYLAVERCIMVYLFAIGHRGRGRYLSGKRRRGWPDIFVICVSRTRGKQVHSECRISFIYVIFQYAKITAVLVSAGSLTLRSLGPPPSYTRDCNYAKFTQSFYLFTLPGIRIASRKMLYFQLSAFSRDAS